MTVLGHCPRRIAPRSTAISSACRIVNPTQFSAVADRPSALSDVLDRVVTIAPAPLLSGEKQADYAEVALRIVRSAKPRDAIEEFLIRDVVDLTWRFFAFGASKPGS